MRHDYASMRVAYGIPSSTDRVEVVGAVRYTWPNSVAVHFNESIAQLGVTMHKLVLLGPASLTSFSSARIPDVSKEQAETRLWSNPKGKRMDRRPETFKGYPIRDNLVMLVPLVGLVTHELVHDGFVEALPSKRHARSLDDL